MTEEPLERAQPNYPAKWVWALSGAGYGVLVRFLLGVVPFSKYGAMSIAFLIGTPIAVGAIAAYGSARARGSLLHATVVPLVPMTLMLLGSAAVLLEGAICIAIMAPLFFVLACLGGVFMSLVLRVINSDKSTLGVFAAIPFLLMPFDRQPLPDSFHELRESTVIAAAPDVVWNQIVSAKEIHADELPTSLVHLIGVPKPIDAENRNTAMGEMRFSRWEKGVHFTALIVEQNQPRSITWRYSFTPDSFPAGSMDEHVVLGGRYLDLGDTTFNLQRLPNGYTQLEVVGRYRLTTPINSYAVPVSQLLGRDFLQMLLGLYKGRAERVAASGG